MRVSLGEVEQQARMLSADERARLAEVLLESFPDPVLPKIESAWQGEVEERVAAYERGEVQTFSLEDVFAEARLIFR
jgi:putative addiction module component (TIGR02574 family)